MNSIVLPPKRWEWADGTKYDPIRFHKWFHRLGKRKVNIALLEAAWNRWPEQELLGVPACDHCCNWQVSEREFRDYNKFRLGISVPATQQEQDAINHAYHQYCESHGEFPFHRHLEACAPLFALNPRHLREKWEVDPAFYPTGYR